MSVTLLPLFAALALGAQSSPGDTIYHLEVGIADGAPQIDGVVEPEEWKNAALAMGFRQYEPRLGAPAGERTGVLVMQDERMIYVAFRVFDPNEPTAQLTRRDADLTSDDVVGVTLDTYRDRQTGYAFLTKRTDFGWTAEFAIPRRSASARSKVAPCS
jgi:hypothetical protein